MMVAVKNLSMMKSSKTLQESQAIGFEKVAQTFGLSTFWFDRLGNIHHFNKNFETLVGYSLADLKNKQVFQLAIQMTYFRLREVWESIEAEHYLEWDDEFLLKGNIQKVKLHCWGLDLFDNELACCLVQIEEPNGKTETASAEPLQAEPYTMHDFTIAAVESTNALVFWLGNNFQIHYLNDRAKLVLDYDFGAGNEISSFLQIDESFANRSWDNLRQNLDKKRRIEVEGTLVNRMGHHIPVEYYLFRLNPDDPNHICLVARDISEKISQEENLRKALETVENLSQKLTTENVYLKEEIQVYNKLDNIVSESKAYQKVLRSIAQVAPTNSTVLILGETGTGKELIAKAIHSLSDRNEKPFLKVNCAALPHDIMESELFGHEKGAFTGAFERRIGRFEAADSGTLFLDEIGEMPLDLQAKLLRVLQEREFERIGSHHPITVNVRIIAATNKDLGAMVAEGRFREDLYYRLNVFPINNIPLRERTEDVRPLVRHFVKKYNQQMGKKINEVCESDMKRLLTYNFPGNIRELENIIERAIILSTSNKLNFSDWNMPLNKSTYDSRHLGKFDSMQKDYILSALDLAKWKIVGKGSATELLGMSSKALHAKMTQLGIATH
ncbi:MAG: AAA domain-containing protein [Bacteroidetes bacterium]|nr:AAA domain-containing protein [Bacteroidota bacterium]